MIDGDEVDGREPTPSEQFASVKLENLVPFSSHILQRLFILATPALSTLSE
jgi:hypothetical protein